MGKQPDNRHPSITPHTPFQTPTLRTPDRDKKKKKLTWLKIAGVGWRFKIHAFDTMRARAAKYVSEKHYSISKKYIMYRSYCHSAWESAAAKHFLLKNKAPKQVIETTPVSITSTPASTQVLETTPASSSQLPSHAIVLPTQICRSLYYNPQRCADAILLFDGGGRKNFLPLQCRATKCQRQRDAGRGGDHRSADPSFYFTKPFEKKQFESKT